MRFVPLALALLALAGCQTQLPPEFRDCREETYAALAALGIDRSDVRRFDSSPVRVFYGHPPGAGDDRIVGYSNWVRLKSCEGAVIFRFTQFCQLQSAGTRGDCAMPGQAAREP